MKVTMEITQRRIETAEISKNLEIDKSETKEIKMNNNLKCL